jgi:fibronectin type 3 domain-containing protein
MLSDFEAGLLTKCVAAPKLTSISNTTAGINVKWGAVGGATEYRVYRRASGENSWTYMGAVKTNQFTDKNVKRGVYYRYTVKAVSGYQSGYNGNGLLIKRS